MDECVDAPNAYIDMIAGPQREAACHILRTSGLDQNCILTERNRRGNGSDARNGRHAHPQSFNRARERASFNFARSQLGGV
jgi:hypothetical protein